MYHWLVLQLIAKFGVIQSQFNSELFEISMTILGTDLSGKKHSEILKEKKYSKKEKKRGQ